MTRRRLRAAGLTSLAAVALVAALVAVLKVGEAAYRVAAQSLRGDTDARLADVSAEAGAQLDRLLAMRWDDVQTLAESPQASSMVPAAIANRMTVTSRRSAPDYGSMVVVDRRGRVVAAFGTGRQPRATDPEATGRDLSSARWFGDALTLRLAVEIDPGDPLAPLLARPARNGHCIAFSAPIHAAGGHILGAWVSVLPPAAIGRVIASTAAAAHAPDLHLYVVDRARRIVASDLADGSFDPALGRSSALAPILAGRTATTTLPAALFRPGAGGSDLVAAAPALRSSMFPGLGWSVIATQGRPEALAAAHRLGREIWLIALIAVAVVLAAAAVVARTVTRASAQRARLEESLRRSQKLEALGRLAGGVAHDFNNVLTVIGGNAQLALGRKPPGEVETHLREIVHASERAGNLVHQLLAFSRPDVSNVTAVDLNAVVESLVRMLPRLIEENVEVSAELAPEPALVLADRAQLEQVLINLAVNARDAMPAGGTLTLRTEVEKATVRLQVADTGAGMDAHTRERIFEPFFTTKPDGEGTGFGLATVYGIVTQAGGSVAVDSAPGEGTTFTIELPRSADDSEPLVDARAPGNFPGRGERVLVVEDDEMVRAVAAEMLGRAGYGVTPVADGTSALRLVQQGERYDLVVCDLMMPGMTGLQLVDELQAHGCDVPVIFVSGYDAEPAAAAEPRPRSASVAKPFTAAELTRAARRLLDAAGADRAARD